MKILTVVGARPQFIKAATISRVIKRENHIREVIVHTGQHYDSNMSDVFFTDLDIPEPDYNLGISGGGHGSMTGRMLSTVEEVIQKERPDWVLVYGDTNSTLAGALAAAKLSIPIAHVESGLRSFNRMMPEEINRVLTDHASNVLFCPTIAAVKQLQNEGFKNVVNQGNFLDTISFAATPKLPRLSQIVVNVGDVMYDAVLHFKKNALDRSTILDKLKQKPKEYYLATVHRSENTTSRYKLIKIMNELVNLARNVTVIIPLHPRTRKILIEIGEFENLKSKKGIILTNPLPYLDFIRLEQDALAIITDSGGVQKEAYFLGVPCFTLRDETEWVETVSNGWNQLVGSNAQNLNQVVTRVKCPSIKNTFDFGNGKASLTIVGMLSQIFVI